MSSPEPSAATSYEALLALVERQEQMLGAQQAVIAEQTARIAELERRLGMDSSNSGTPTSKEPIAAAAKRKARRQSCQRVRSKDRKPGGQPGRKGSGLEPARDDELDDTQRAGPPAECRACGADLDETTDAGAAWAQVWDIPPIVVERVGWVLPRRRCACCSKVTTASVPFAQAGSVTYGPNVNAAAILLGSEGNVPVERTAMLMAALLGAPVSAGFLARAHQRLAERLDAAGFTARLKDALRAGDVLCGDETPVNIAFKNTGPDGEPVPGAEHVITLRTPDERLVLLEAVCSRSAEAIRAVGVLTGWRGYLVRDDYAGRHQFDTELAGVGLCGVHLIRSLQGVFDLHPGQQAWAADVQQILREANQAVTAAKAARASYLDPARSMACANAMTTE